MDDLWNYEVLNEEGQVLTKGGPCPYEVAQAAITLTLDRANTVRRPDGFSQYLANGKPCVLKFTRVKDGKVMTEAGDVKNDFFKERVSVCQ